MSNKTLTVNDDTAEPWWGLSRNVIPCFGAVWFRKVIAYITWLTAPA